MRRGTSFRRPLYFTPSVIKEWSLNAGIDVPSEIPQALEDTRERERKNERETQTVGEELASAIKVSGARKHSWRSIELITNPGLWRLCASLQAHSRTPPKARVSHASPLPSTYSHVTSRCAVTADRRDRRRDESRVRKISPTSTVGWL